MAHVISWIWAPVHKRHRMLLCLRSLPRAIWCLRSPSCLFEYVSATLTFLHTEQRILKSTVRFARLSALPLARVTYFGGTWTLSSLIEHSSATWLGRGQGPTTRRTTELTRLDLDEVRLDLLVCFVLVPPACEIGFLRHRGPLLLSNWQ